MVVCYVDKLGRKKVQGGVDLKTSQAYPRGFAEAIVELQQLHAQELRETAQRAYMAARRSPIHMGNYLRSAEQLNANNWWGDGAGFASVLEFLRTSSYRC